MTFEGSDLDGLLPTTPVYRWQGRQQFIKTVAREYDRLESDPTSQASERVAFTDLNEGEFTRHFVDTYDRNMIKSWKSYTPSQQLLLVKMSLPAHAIALVKFHDALIRALNRNNPELEDELQPFPNVQVHGINKAKQPDNGWGPLHGTADRSEKWPAVVLEAGLSERTTKLQSDAQWWLSNSDGDVKIALTMSVNRREPSIEIHKWEHENNRPRISQTIKLWKDAEGNDQPIQTDGAPLLIEFDKLFLRAPAMHEHDIRIESDDLRRVAKAVWVAQRF